MTPCCNKATHLDFKVARQILGFFMVAMADLSSDVLCRCERNWCLRWKNTASPNEFFSMRRHRLVTTSLPTQTAGREMVSCPRGHPRSSQKT